MNCPTILLAILDFCLNILSEDRFRFCYVIGNHFIRKRKLGFKDFMLCLAFSPKKSLQSILYGYIQTVWNKDTRQNYSKQAYSKQRQFIRPEALLEFINASVQKFYTSTAYKTFHGYIVTAIDGSRYNLPNNPELKEKYGEQHTSGGSQVQALGSCLYDIFNGLVLHCLFAPYKSSERDLAEEHINILANLPYGKFLLLFDRGYPSYDMFHKIQEQGLSFVMRAPSHFIKNLCLKGSDCVISYTSIAYPKTSITVRVVTITIPFGEKVYLITNLKDEGITVNDFMELYHARWGIESKYNDLKNKLDIENFTGVSDIALQQDYYATVFLSNLAAVLIFEMENVVQLARRSGNKYQYKQNMNLTLGELRANVIQLILADSRKKQKYLLMEIVERLRNAVIPIRPHRAFKRERKHKSMQFPQNMKRA